MDSLHSLPYRSAAGGGLRSERRPTATDQDIAPPLEPVSQELCSYYEEGVCDPESRLTSISYVFREFLGEYIS